ncbi:hypothetical protein HOO65_070018 [Ceratocystis lukuohia]|uniref:Retrovirus-related Pol polyprotein from transposon TNT 1-94-like beta-barrel domain-containing protein n=1 Tax=Ceratocystis lukuohia TaxID=2019550 RepID=A0ABR4MBB5_9PEZI
MGFAEDYGFADYLRTPLGTVTEEQYLLLTDGPAKALRAKRFFQAYLHEEFETMYIEAYPKLNACQILEKLDKYFGTSGYDELLNAAESFDILWSSADSIPPIEFARRLTNLFGLFSFLKAPVDTKFTLALLDNKIGKRNPEWMTPPEMVRHINGNLGSPTYAVETRNTTPVAMATAKQDDKKKKKKKGNNPHHPKGVHDDEECREHPDKKKATEPSKAVTIGRSAGTALFTPALSSIEGDPVHPDLWFVNSCASFHMTGNRSLLANFKPIERMPIEGSGGMLYTQGVGSITINTRTSAGTKVLLTLEDVRLVQGLSKNLISTSQPWQNGVVHFDQRVPALKRSHSEDELSIVRLLGGVYYILGFAEV